VSEDKLQFFSRAEGLPGALAVSRRMRQWTLGTSCLYGAGSPTPSELAATSTARIHPRHRALRYDANTLELVVENDLPGPIWLSYSDTWHPFWRASVNGRAVPIAVAQLAYKAVLLSPGRNHVRFHFEPDLLLLLRCASRVLPRSSGSSWAALWRGAFSGAPPEPEIYATLPTGSGTPAS
jgi:hypothetical protein